MFNLAIAKWNNALDGHSPQDNQNHALQQILGAPFVPAVILLVSLCWCMESPRYYMQLGTPHRNPSRAYEILLRARKTQVSKILPISVSPALQSPQLQALRDLYLLHKSVELDGYHIDKDGGNIEMHTIFATQSSGHIKTASGVYPQMLYVRSGLTYASNLQSGLYHAVNQYRDLFTKPKLRNAMVSTCVVALAQQLCGSMLASLRISECHVATAQLTSICTLVNVFAFYSSENQLCLITMDSRLSNRWGTDKITDTFFASKSNYQEAMGYSAGFGKIHPWNTASSPHHSSRYSHAGF